MNTFLTALLETMGTAVGFEFDPVEIKKGYYSPMGHGEMDAEQTIIRKGFADIVSGKKKLPISFTRDNTDQ